jgi:hypothetical protein
MNIDFSEGGAGKDVVGVFSFARLTHAMDVHQWLLGYECGKFNPALHRLQPRKLSDTTFGLAVSAPETATKDVRADFERCVRATLRELPQDEAGPALLRVPITWHQKDGLTMVVPQLVAFNHGFGWKDQVVQAGDAEPHIVFHTNFPREAATIASAQAVVEDSSKATMSSYLTTVLRCAVKTSDVKHVTVAAAATPQTEVRIQHAGFGKAAKAFIGVDERARLDAALGLCLRTHPAPVLAVPK